MASKTTTIPVDPMALSEYIVKTAIKHNRKTYKPGTKINLTAAQAKHAKGAVEPAK